MKLERESIRAPKRKKKRGRFLLGLVTGVAAGAGAGTMLLRREEGDLPEFGLTDESPPRVADTAGGSPAPATASPVQRAPAAVKGQATGLVDAVKQRWQEAIAQRRLFAG
jgi:hypothetical protein